MPISRVAPTLETRYGPSSGCRVFVRTEPDVVYGDVMVLVDALQAAGFKLILVAEEVAP